MLAVTASAIGVAILQSSITSLASEFGAQEIQALEAGKSLAYLILTLCKIMSWQIAQPSSPGSVSFAPMITQTSVAIAISLGSVALYSRLRFCEYARASLEKFAFLQISTPIRICIPFSVRPTCANSLSETSTLFTRESAQVEVQQYGKDFLDQDQENTIFSDDEGPVTMFLVLKKTWPSSAVVTAMTLLTLLSFPGLVPWFPLAESYPQISVPNMLVLAATGGLFVGTCLPLKVPCLSLPLLSRITAIQGTLLIVFGINHWYSMGLIVTIVMVLVLGLTCGFTVTSALMLAPRLADERERAVVGVTSVLIWNINLLIGMYSAYLLENLLSY